jgi:hypothetical protein
MATGGDFLVATNGDFLMATDNYYVSDFEAVPGLTEV